MADWTNKFLMVVDDVTGDHYRATPSQVVTDASAAEVPFTPYGNVAATDTQEAIEELDDEKAGLILDNTFSGVNTHNGRSIFNLNGSSSSLLASFVLQRTDDGSSGARFVTYHNSANPAISDIPFLYDVRGNDSAAAEIIYARQYAEIASPTAGAAYGGWAWNTTINSVNSLVLRIRQGMFFPGATGSDQGIGTVNATAVYDDGVLLTCFPFHESMGQAEWDAITPNRKHEASYNETDVPTGETAIADGKSIPVMRTERVLVEPERVEERSHRTAKRHFDMLAEGYKPDDPRSFVDRMRADGAVPGAMTLAEWQRRMPLNDDGTLAEEADKPSAGEFVTRLQLQVDYMAKALGVVLDRLEAAEAALAKVEATLAAQPDKASQRAS